MTAVPARESTDLVDMYGSDDGEDNTNNHFLREDWEEKEAVGPVQPDPIPAAPTYVDPYVTVKELLWMLPGINEIVRSVLARMETAFAYNSVYFLKIILELQATYKSAKLGPPPSAILDKGLVLRVAEIMAGRMVRREKEGSSLSKELQLRTLISALSLLCQLDIGTLDKATFAKLFKDISERDSENKAKQNRGKRGKFCNGDNEFLIRYACDLIRCMPNDFPAFREMNSEAVHFIFAAGFINQLEVQTDRSTLASVFARIAAPPSKWHKDMQELYEDTAGVISSHHLAQSRYATTASQFAGILAETIVNGIAEKAADCAITRPTRDTQVEVCGLLDLMNQLAAAFPQSQYIVGKAKTLALELIRDSDNREFRYKAFEIFVSSATGYPEAEYYDMMRSLDFEIENTARASGHFDTRSEGEKLRALERVDELKREKREAMDRCETRAILFKGAVESIQRRLQGGRSPARVSRKMEELLRVKTPWSEEARSVITASPVPSSLPSQVPTLSSQAPTCDSGPSPTATPTCESMLSPAATLLSPTDSATCKSLLSPTDTCHTLLSPFPRDETPAESPILPYPTPTDTSPNVPNYQTGLLQEPLTPNEDNCLRFNGLGELFSDARLSLFDEPEDYDPPIEQANTRKMSIDLPIQSFDASDDEKEEIPVLMDIPELQSIDSVSDFRKKPSMDLKRNSVISQTLVEPPEPSPKSTYPEPSLSRTPSSQTQTGSLRRQSRASKIFSRRPGSIINRHSRRFHSLQLNKPLPPVIRSKESIVADDAPEPVNPDAPAQLAVFEPVRSQSAMEMRNDKMDLLRIYNSSSALGIYTDHPALRPVLPPIVVDGIPSPTSPKIEYESQPSGECFKITPKDSSFNVFLSSDAKYAVYLAPHAFQAFAIPARGETMSQKPRFYHRMGSAEGRRKIKFTPLQSYRVGAASERYIVTGTKDQIQLHDLQKECKVVFEDSTKGWEPTCVALSQEKLAVGLSNNVTNGMIRIYKMNAPTYTGPRCEVLRDFRLPTAPGNLDAPHILNLSRDGNYLTCATPRFGYYFSWDLSRVGTAEPNLICSGKLTITEGPDAEFLTGATLFPNAKHIFCSTYPVNATKSEWGPPWAGSFTEPTTLSPNAPNHRQIRQSSLRVASSAIAPAGNACAFLTKGGTIWVIPAAYLEGDDNMTTFAPTRSAEKMHYPQTPKNAGSITFTPAGDQLVAADKKGKIMVLTFRKVEYSPEWHRKNDIGGYY